MSKDTFPIRFAQALRESGLSPGELATKVGTTDATISNWQNDKVKIDHLKAALLLKIAAAVKKDPYELLFGAHIQIEGHRISDTRAEYFQSQVLKPDTLTLAIQLASEQLEQKGLTLPPNKRAQLITLMYELLDEGLPEAKVLRFARVAAA